MINTNTMDALGWLRKHLDEDGGNDMVREMVAASKPTVTRIAGADRYATAAAAAGMIDADSSWCGTDAASAVLINGSSDALPFGVAVQTTAYRLQLPVLMTAADELPDATAEFITENDIEHVQIIGGTDTVSAGVASALTTLGVDTVARVDGDSAAAVSVELAKLAGNGCGDDLAPVSTNRVVLVRGNPDGVAAAPVLASTLANGDLVTPLIVGDTLPASVRDYLAATPKVVGGERLALGIVAIGGTAAVKADVMTAAVNAAASAGTLTVQIGASMDTDNDKKPANPNDPVRPGTTFSLYFSDDVVAAPSDNAEGADATDGLGRTQFAIEVGFNGYISAAVSDELLEDILARTLARNRGATAAETYLTTLRTALGIASVTDADTIVGGAPTRTVRYEMETASVALMPMNRDRVETAAGAVLLADNPATTDTETEFRPAVAHVATGYKEDVNTTTANSRVDESRNGKSDLRISQTGSVKARN